MPTLPPDTLILSAQRRTECRRWSLANGLAAAHSVHMAACHANKQERSPQETTVKLSPDRQIGRFLGPSARTGPREHQWNRAEVLVDIRHLQTVAADSVPGV